MKIIDWLDEEAPKIISYIGEDEITPSNAITIDKWEYLRKGDLLFSFDTGELMYLKETPKSKIVSVSRSVVMVSAVSFPKKIWDFLKGKFSDGRVIRSVLKKDDELIIMSPSWMQ